MTKSPCISTRGKSARAGAGGMMLLLPLLLGAAPATPETPSLAELQSAVETTVASMPAFSIRFTVENEPHEEPDEQADPRLKEYVGAWGPKRYLWMKSGNRVLVTSEQDQVTTSFDGRKAYRSQTNHASTFIKITAQINDPSSLTKPDCLIGLAVPQAIGTLADVLRHPTAAVTGSEVIEGATCHRIEVRGLTDRSGEAGVRLTVWLDPARDMLPRRLAAAFDQDDPRFQGQDPGSQKLLGPLRYRWEMTDFVQIPNPVRGSASWFPKRAYFYQPWCRQEWLIEEATIHASLPDERFRPPAPQGAIVRDETQAKPVRSIVGGRKALSKAVNRAAVNAETIAAQGPPGAVDATPKRGLPWSSLIFWGSSGLLVAAAVVWFRRRI